MKTPQTAAIVALIAATIASGTVAWQQYQRAEKLAAAIAAASAPVSPPVAAERTAPERVDAAPADADPHIAAEGDATEPPPPAPVEGQRFRGGRNDPGARFSQLMENPEFASAWLAQQKARLDDRYASLFRKLNLNPAQIDQLKTLLAERQTSRMDVMSAARSEGMTGRENRDELRALIQQTEAEIDGSIRALIGDAAYAQLQHYEQTTPQRSLVGQLETRLSYSSAPLSAAQSEALVNILAETAGGSGRAVTGEVATVMALGPGRPAVSFAAGGGLITDAAIARAQGVLTPSQVDALKQLQAEQQSQRQINEMMRRQFQGNRTTNTPTTGAGGG